MASVLCSLAVRLFGRPDLRVLMGIPAVLLTAWAFFGYLVTLDDDAPGGWSNPVPAILVPIAFAARRLIGVVWIHLLDSSILRTPSACVELSQKQLIYTVSFKMKQ